MNNLDGLPDDPAQLKRMIAERDTVIAERDHLIDRIRHEAATRLEARRLRLEAEHKAAVDAIPRRSYGPHGEWFDPRQLLLFGIAVDQVPLDEAGIEEESGEKLATRRVRNRHGHGRGPLPEHPPRTVIEHDLTEPQKACPDRGRTRRRIGHEESAQLEYLPSSPHVLKHVRYKYACQRCETEAICPHIEIAAKAPQPIERGLCGPGLLAYVITSKFGDHLPLYRLQQIFARQQVHVARSTMCAWLAAAAELVRPLVDFLTERVRRSRVIHTDETRVPGRRVGSPVTRATRKPTRTAVTTAFTTRAA